MRGLRSLVVKDFSSSSIGRNLLQAPFWATNGIGGHSPGDREQIEHNFVGYVQGALKNNGVVFACMLARQLVFSEARFMYQEIVDGRPGQLRSGPGLSILETPWPNATTGELLARMEQDVSLAGNFYATTAGTGSDARIRRLRPDWVTVITGSPTDDPFDIEARPIGYLYSPPVRGRRTKPDLLTVDQVVHWSPVPDPEAQWRGMSWITPVVREIQADTAATKHKLKYFEHGMAGGLKVSFGENVDKDLFDFYVAKFLEQHAGADNAYKTFFLGGGADAATIGADLKQLDFKVTQGAGETRIAAASGLGAVIVQLSEGLQGSSLNTGNFSAARRRSSDMFFRPQWRSAASALAKFAAVPSGSRLWYDERDIAFLKEDAKDAAEILSTNAVTITELVKEGFTPESAIEAVTAGDLSRLKHSGLVSVQLQQPGTTPAESTTPAEPTS